MSWFSKSFGAFMFKSKAPRENETFVPSETVADAGAQGTAMPVIVLGASSPAEASRVMGTLTK
jgi:hypothetical protein